MLLKNEWLHVNWKWKKRRSNKKKVWKKNQNEILHLLRHRSIGKRKKFRTQEEQCTVDMAYACRPSHRTLHRSSKWLCAGIMWKIEKTMIMEIECNFHFAENLIKWAMYIVAHCATHSQTMRDVLTISDLITNVKEAYKTDFIGHICILMAFVFELMEYLHGIWYASCHEIKGYWNNFPSIFLWACSSSSVRV